MRAFTRRAARRAARIRQIYAINSAGIVRMQIVKIDDVVGICQFEFEMLRICFQSLNQLCCLSIHTPGFLNDFGVASRGPTAKRQPHFRQHLSLLIFLRIETRNRQWVIETMPLVCLIFSGVVCCVFFFGATWNNRCHTNEPVSRYHSTRYASFAPGSTSAP